MPTTIAFSVGDNGPDRKSGTPTVDVSGTTMTFSEPQVGNIGIGDVVLYGGNEAHLCEKISSTVWEVRSPTAGSPAAASGVAVTSIKRTFATLRDAVHAGMAGGSGMSARLGLTQEDANPLDLVAEDLYLKIALYKDAVDASAGTIDARSIIGDETRPLWIGTPHDTASECNQSQYPSRLKGSGYVVTRILQPRNSSFIIFEGIEVDGTVNGIADGLAETSSALCKWISCRAHGCSDLGLELHEGAEAHNCIVHHCGRGIVTGGPSGSVNPVLRGCIAYGNTGAGYTGDTVDGVGHGCIGMANGGGDFLSSSLIGSSTSCVSSDASAPGTGQLIDKTAYTDYFEDPENGDFTLKGTTANGGVFGGTGVQTTGPAADSSVLDYDASHFSRAGESLIDVGPFEFDPGGEPPPPPDPSPDSDENVAIHGELVGELRGVA